MKYENGASLMVCTIKKKMETIKKKKGISWLLGFKKTRVIALCLDEHACDVKFSQCQPF